MYICIFFVGYYKVNCHHLLNFSCPDFIQALRNLLRIPQGFLQRSERNGEMAPAVARRLVWNQATDGKRGWDDQRPSKIMSQETSKSCLVIDHT